MGGSFSGVIAQELAPQRRSYGQGWQNGTPHGAPT
jgi:hypothetical protein